MIRYRLNVTIVFDEERIVSAPIAVDTRATRISITVTSISKIC